MVKAAPIEANALIPSILSELKQRLRMLYAGNFVKIVLYGSQARGDATIDSDIDVLLVLKKCGSPFSEIDKVNDILLDFLLRTGELIALFPVSEKEFSFDSTPLILNIRKEGVEI